MRIVILAKMAAAASTDVMTTCYTSLEQISCESIRDLANQDDRR